MKVFSTLCFTLLLLSNAYANILQDIDNEIHKIETDIQNLLNSSWLGALLGNTFGFLKDALNDLEGTECIINTIISIDESALAIPSELKNCGSSSYQNFSEIETTIQNIETAAAQVKELMLEHCDSLQAITKKYCYKSVFSKMVELIKKSKLMLGTLQSLPQSEVCIINAIDGLVHLLQKLPNTIEKCAQLF